jgi:hypothetical protein
MKTYILIMQTNDSGITYFKVGKTKDLEKRLRIYQLHNPAITDILLLDEDIENDVLFDYRWQRIQNESGRDSEWVEINYDYIAEELKERYHFEDYKRTLKGGETIDSRMFAYEKSLIIDISELAQTK